MTMVGFAFVKPIVKSCRRSSVQEQVAKIQFALSYVSIRTGHRVLLWTSMFSIRNVMDMDLCFPFIVINALLRKTKTSASNSGLYICPTNSQIYINITYTFVVPFAMSIRFDISTSNTDVAMPRSTAHHGRTSAASRVCEHDCASKRPLVSPSTALEAALRVELWNADLFNAKFVSVN